MIRSDELIEKLIADLHFHNYLQVYEGDIFGSSISTLSPQVNDFLSSLGIDSKTSFYHGGRVGRYGQEDYIYQYVDDVFLDYFFRTYNFKKIVFPKGFCCEQITKDGIIHPVEDVYIDLNNIYDRCTFVYNLWRLFGCDLRSIQCETLHCEGFLNNISIGREKRFSPAEELMPVLIDNGLYPFGRDYALYLEKFHPGRAIINPLFRTKEIINFSKYLRKLSNSYDFIEGKSRFCFIALDSFVNGFHQIAENHIFGDYSIEDLLIMYCVLIDKLEFHEDTFLLPLLYCIKDVEKTFLMELRTFEFENTDYHVLDPYIDSRDLYLRFTSRVKSKAFKFSYTSDTVETIQLFEENPIYFVFLYNTMPLPYLYQKINLNII